MVAEKESQTKQLTWNGPGKKAWQNSQAEKGKSREMTEEPGGETFGEN
jgi:hypothetical protein